MYVSRFLAQSDHEFYAKISNSFHLLISLLFYISTENISFKEKIQSLTAELERVKCLKLPESRLPTTRTFSNPFPTADIKKRVDGYISSIERDLSAVRERGRTSNEFRKDSNNKALSVKDLVKTIEKTGSMEVKNPPSSAPSGTEK